MDTDDTALQLSEVLTRSKCGRLSFMPLNRLQPGAVQYPRQYGQDVVPLMKRLKFNEQFRPAMQQVGGWGGLGGGRAAVCGWVGGWARGCGGVGGGVRGVVAVCVWVWVAGDVEGQPAPPHTPTPPLLPLPSPLNPSPHPPQVFGKTLVCRTLELAQKVSRETGLNCVTMEGDNVRAPPRLPACLPACSLACVTMEGDTVPPPPPARAPPAPAPTHPHPGMRLCT